MKSYKFLYIFIAFTITISSVWFFHSLEAEAQSSKELDKLKNDLAERSSRLDEIEKEIARFETELGKIGGEKQSLQKAINQLSLEKKKTEAEISKTENLISLTDLEISKLTIEMDKTETTIEKNKKAISEIMRKQYQDSNITFLELMLQNKKLSEFVNDVKNKEVVKNNLSVKVSELSSLHETLGKNKDDNSKKRSNLSSLKSQYSDQKVILGNNQAEQSKLLEVTKNEEKTYQNLLSEQISAREQIEKELREFESKILFLLDPNTIPAPGTAVFAWPLKSFVITQLFGGTEFASNNASVYGGRPYHPGVDFGVPRGTPIYAPLAGTVRATGNTDLVPGCLSWGKWALLDHANGLSTLYAHQDLVSITPGQKVATGEIIGYTGSTGYSTGPHLHFTVYAKDGVSVRKFNEIKTSTSCGPATTPVAASDAYLDPMLYLPG